MPDENLDLGSELRWVHCPAALELAIDQKACCLLGGTIVTSDQLVPRSIREPSPRISIHIGLSPCLL
jgi:hypothetical protein